MKRLIVAVVAVLALAGCEPEPSIAQTGNRDPRLGPVCLQADGGNQYGCTLTIICEGPVLLSTWHDYIWGATIRTALPNDPRCVAPKATP